MKSCRRVAAALKSMRVEVQITITLKAFYFSGSGTRSRSNICRISNLVRRIENGSTEPYSLSELFRCTIDQLMQRARDDEESRSDTFGKGRCGTSSLPRLAASVHAKQSAEVLD